jgi:MinD superfamily P-loop ATPase
MPSGPTRLCVTDAKGATGKTTTAIDVAGGFRDTAAEVHANHGTMEVPA